MECNIDLKYQDKRTAYIIANSIEPDNEDFVEMELDGATVRLSASAENPLRLLQILDDLLACVTIAEETHDAE